MRGPRSADSAEGSAMDGWQFHALEDHSPADLVEVDGEPLRQGDRVRLRPEAGGDIFDIALAGQTATIEAIEQDYDGRVHLAISSMRIRAAT